MFEKLKRKVFCVLMLVITLAVAGCMGAVNGAESRIEDNSSREQQVKVTVLDVGQGDALLIQTPEENIMIDTGDVDEREKLLAELKKTGIQTIDKLIITHPHADHLGGAEVVLRNYAVKAVYDNGQPTTTKLYRKYLETIKQKQITYHALYAGEILDFGGGVTFKVFSPTQEMIKSQSDLNANSIVGKLSYGDFSMLFTGDSEAETEKQILAKYGSELKCNVLKSPHHGSKTSSSLKYLQQIAPENIVISLGQGNEYGHPHEQVLKRYAKLNAKVYRTDKCGTITITTDGSSYTVKGEKNDVDDSRN